MKVLLSFSFAIICSSSSSFLICLFLLLLSNHSFCPIIIISAFRVPLATTTLYLNNNNYPTTTTIGSRSLPSFSVILLPVVTINYRQQHNTKQEQHLSQCPTILLVHQMLKPSIHRPSYLSRRSPTVRRGGLGRLRTGGGFAPDGRRAIRLLRYEAKLLEALNRTIAASSSDGGGVGVVESMNVETVKASSDLMEASVRICVPGPDSVKRQAMLWLRLNAKQIRLKVAREMSEHRRMPYLIFALTKADAPADLWEPVGRSLRERKVAEQLRDEISRQQIEGNYVTNEQ
eukprot:GHVS01072481.1.p1 GENE.GHVS01072481.1~~GHVS01072481.1.p1  ORF type:complete len:288 (-),score=42.95 GHVS01072481.1:126-989(-)